MPMRKKKMKSPSILWGTLSDGSDGEKLPGVWQKKNSPGF